MPDRFYVETPISGIQTTISGDSAHHILNVMRLKVGASLVLFDGTDQEFQATITSTSKKQLEVHIDSSKLVSRELDHDLTLAVALPKGDRQKVLIEKLVEIGVTRLIPLNTERSVAVANEKSVERLKRRVIEASKQSGRNRLMQISRPQMLADVLCQSAEPETRLIAHPYGNPVPLVRAAAATSETPNVLIAIGPEGGFSDPEIETAESNRWQRVSLGPTILRVETAAVVAGVILGIGRPTHQAATASDHP